MDSMRTETSRELSAIFFADIVGYTAMMEQDEEMALARLNRYQNVLNEKLKSFQGTLIKNYGDGSLCLFNSVLNAVRCAEAIQNELSLEPKIPLRIGLHLGDVTYLEGDVYGNDINIASRIESLGIPGSVLTSAELYNKIKNQKGLEFKSIGKFHFKNVKNEMEIFALANEGITIPRKDQVSGKLQKRKNNVGLKWIVATISVAVLILVGYRNLYKPISPLSEDIKEKRITVRNFQNQTMDPNMEVYGNMISDWLTKGLMETGEANIINAANIKDDIDKSNPGETPNPEFSAATGVDIILEGRYYIAEANLFIVANFIDVNSGKILHFVQLDAERDEYIDLLKEITNEIMSYWVVKDNVQFSLKPPKFEAYKDWLEGEKLYTTDAIEAIIKYEDAFLKDTSFYPPLFRLFSLYSNTRNSQKMKEVLDYLDQHQSSFSKYEMLEYEKKKYFLENNYEAGAKASEEKYKMDPSDFKANYDAAYLYNLSRNYNKALEIIKNLDSRYVKDVGLQKEWRLASEAHAYYKLGDYNRVIELAEENPDARYFTPYVVHHLMSLVRVDSLLALDQAYQRYANGGTYEPSGKPTQSCQFLILVCSELYITNKAEALNKYITKLDDWLDKNRVLPFPHTIPDIYNNFPFREEEVKGYLAFFKRDYVEAINHWTKEDIPNSNWADLLERASRLGVCYAYLNDNEKAQEQINFMNTLFIDDRNFELTREYYKARIYSALNNKSEAIRLISDACKKGLMFFRPFVMENDPFLFNIVDQPDFLDLIVSR